jgi:hypothetical protein
MIIDLHTTSSLDVGAAITQIAPNDFSDDYAEHHLPQL